MRLIGVEKRQVRALVVDRVALAAGSKECVPADIATAWTPWEDHFFDTLYPSPWQDYSSYPVTSAKREETREKRLGTLIEDAANGLRIKQLRRT